MTQKSFAPKDAETLKSEITTELGIDYEGNEDLVDKMVNRELKSEQFKNSLHEDKVKHLKGKEDYKQRLVKAGFDPETGEKIETKASATTTTTAPSNEGMSLKDIRALQDVNDEDVDEVIEYAKFKGVSIAEAKKTSVIQNILRDKEEVRKTANATNTSGSKRNAKDISADQIVSAGLEGKEVDPVKFAEAQMEIRTRKKS